MREREQISLALRGFSVSGRWAMKKAPDQLVAGLLGGDAMHQNVSAAEGSLEP
jgi:hypothetical protein